jgi:NADH dehydrogenase
MEALQQLGVGRLGTAVTQCDGRCDGRGGTAGCRTIVWGAGVMASAAAQWLGVARIVWPSRRSADLTCWDRDFCISGGLCLVPGKPLPGLAPSPATGTTLLRRALPFRQDAGTFRYHGWGTMATIGRRDASPTWDELDGTLAWLLWAPSTSRS